MAEILTQIRRFLTGKRAVGYLVGGFLRDRFLGILSKDLDVVVGGAEPSALASHLHKTLGFSRPVTFPRFRTALTAGRGIKVEACALRGNPGQDATGRDFTLNCLYADLNAPPTTRRAPIILDPTGRGLTDLRRGLLRTPVDPCVTLWLDPNRILRALRLGATRGFRLDTALRECIPRLVYLLRHVAPERARTEIEHILLSDRVISAFRQMAALGVCDVLLPELALTRGFDQATPYHAYDLFTHTIRATANAPPDLVLRLAALLHDLGKPGTRSMRGGRAVYYRHQAASAELAVRLMRRLKLPRRIRDRVAFLVLHHMIHYTPAWSDKAVRRFVRKMGPHLEETLDLAEADQKAQVRGPSRDLPARALRKRIRDLKKTDSIHLEPPIGGHEIMAILGIPEGPSVGKAKSRLREEASKRERPMSRAEAVRLLREWSKDGFEGQ